MTAVLEAARKSGPYKGLTYFTEQDAAFFFGREEVRDLIIADLKASSLSLVYGQSGVGKSSLLRAGVAATLREEARREFSRFGSAEFVPVVFSNWRDDPLEAIASAISAAADEFALGDRRPVGPVATGPDLREGRLAEVIEIAARRTGASLLVILDQFEEYFLYHRKDDGPLSFSEQFAFAVNRRGLPAGFLVATRDDALAQLDVFKGRIPKLFSSYRRVSPLSKRAAGQAILGPVTEYNRQVGAADQVSVEPQLLAAVVEQVSAGKVKLDSVGAGVLDGAGTDAVEAPYLQLVMSRIWQEEASTGSHELRLSTLESLGGAQKIVRSHLDATLAALPASDQDVAADVFHHLVTPSGTKIAHAVSDLVDYTHWPEEKVAAVLERLSGDMRIVRPVQPPSGSEGPPRYEIFHDVLAPAVLDWRGRHEKDSAHREKEAAQHLAAVQRRRAMVAWATAGFAIVLLAVLVVTYISQIRQQNATRSRVLASYAAANLANDPQLSTLLAVSAVRKSPTAQAQTALRQAFPEIQEQRSLSLGHWVSATAVSPNGREVAAGSSDNGEVKIWRAGYWEKPWSLPTSFSSVNGLAFSPNGRSLAVVGDVADAKQWRAGHWPGVEVFSGSGKPTGTVLFIPKAEDKGQWGQAVAWAGPASGGQDYLVTADDRGYICLYVPLDPSSSRCARSIFDDLNTVSLDQAGTAAVVSNDSGATFYSVPALQPVGGPAKDELWGLGEVTDAVVSPDGQEVATTSAQGITMVYSAKTGYYVAKLGTRGQVMVAAFNQSGSMLATTTDVGQTTVWQLFPQSQLGGIQVAQLNCDCGVVSAAQFDPASPSELVTGSEDGVVRLWGATPRGLLASYPLSQSFPFYPLPDGINGLANVPGLGDVVALIAGPNVKGGNPNPDRATVLDLKTGRYVTLATGSQVLDVQSVSASQPRHGAPALLVGLVSESTGAAVKGWLVRNVGGTPQLAVSRLPTPAAWPDAGKAQPSALAVSPNGAWLAADFANSDIGTVDLVNLKTGRTLVLPKTPTYSYAVNSLAFDSDSDRVIASWNSGVAWDWSLPAGRGGPRFLGQYGDPDKDAIIQDAEYSPDGRQVVLADSVGNVSVFDAKTHEEAFPEPFNAGAGQVNSAVFSANGQEVLTSSDDGTAQVWDLATGIQLLTLEPTDEPSPTGLNDAVFDQIDGQTVVVLGGNDGVVRVWSASEAAPNLQEMEALATKRLEGRCYTPAELREFGSPAQVFAQCN